MHRIRIKKYIISGTQMLFILLNKIWMKNRVSFTVVVFFTSLNDLGFLILPELKKTQVFSMPISAPLANFRNILLVTKLKLFSRAFIWAQSHICSFIRLEVTFKWRCMSQNFISQLEEKEAISDWKLFLYGCHFCNHTSIYAHFVTNHGAHMKVT